ncbi:CaiB/BaiF CoA transferase family protein [Phytohabitans suffuscus]|uniref:CoA transferase n=1 Tax=Phytohabitans suffuscus TaxID=624315 RepID=A0A6F8YV39_9ACTN|nr:CaiB/BaiF CoA-transferase family protein [Phytohabitans suffuscus]BCB89853.1 CoA transferase [Phytohabitans suffuscus]
MGHQITPGPLAGITVVGLEQAVAAPFATRQLADLGARVIKIERPGGGDFARGYDGAVHGLSSYFVWLNRAKQSLSLDVKDERGRAVLTRLLAGADVFVHNLGPGAVDRLGFGAAALGELNPRLVNCAITGFGSDGPWAGRKAYDLLIQCQTGLVSLTGGPEAGARVGVSVADIAAGMYAFSGVLTGLLARATTGVARAVEVSLFDALAEWMSQPAYYTRYGGTQPPRLGTHHATIAPYGAYRAGDGRDVLLAVQNDTEWRVLCTEFLGRPDLVDDPRFATSAARVGNRAALDEVIAAECARQDSPKIMDQLDRLRIANSPINDVHDFLDHPVLAERGRWRPVDSPAGTFEALVPPVAVAGVEPVFGPVPAAGEHTDAILAELGYTPADIAGLRGALVV